MFKLLVILFLIKLFARKDIYIKSSKKIAGERYQDLSEEEKNKKEEYDRERYKNLLEHGNQRRTEY